ncbi:universal stress protein [Acinetobacter bohemicus]|uniref:Universal stress protein n=1 Tax=Acinetobacter lwoffii TaxID=28090 RepID=A0A9D2ZZE3_ACILW|nr:MULTISPECIES: universal stress protein [Acinetobacter]MDM1780519.1 universal stress protein [Acinetobacter indicus]HJF27857.1 universal stress protein [Acinetobacter lwoffii]MCO8042516.1 universal stress protein [Acinetobacter sp. S4400-12]MCO8045523.1 universal stress protein [Acinetobacter sp. S4397-1]MCU7224286.1 universal stress protein [Acinetobacter bohemicus]
MQNYDNLLVALDESSISYAAAEHALEMAKVFHSKVTLLSVIAVDPFKGVDFYKVAPAVTDYFLQAEQHALDRLTELKESFIRDGVPVITKIIHGMAPSEGILQASLDSPTDLIIMGSHGRKGLQKLMLGSVAQNVLAQSEIPVLIVKQ